MTDYKDAVYSQLKQLSVLTVIPVILLVGPLVGFFIGGWIDRRAGSYPWFTLLFLILGFTAAGREITRLLKQVLKDDKQSHSRPRSRSGVNSGGNEERD